MKMIRAYSCIREGARSNARKAGSSVCFLLDEAHASHTLRTFLRGQGDSAVLEQMSDAEASRLLGAEPDASSAASK
jgi:hypothetical protein